MLLSFSPYTKDTGRLLTFDNHLNFRWNDPNCKILFSVTQQGKAAVSHFTSDKAGLRKLRQALNDWCNFCFSVFDCEMVIGVIERPSVTKLAADCGFKQIASFGNKKVYARRKQWAD